MRILVVGAGGIGGYFGGRLLNAGRDVTFLVRPRRAAQLAKDGLMIRSPLGNLDLPAPPTVSADTLKTPFDAILLSCKGYDLEDAMASFAGAVGPDTVILPMLNGMSHLDALDARFGAEHVFGGQCLAATLLESDGRVVHLNDAHSMTFGERDGSRSARAEAIHAAFSGAEFDAILSTEIMQVMWDKWVFLATCAGITSLMRAPIGDIVAAGASSYAIDLLNECAATAAAAGYKPSAATMERNTTLFTMPGSPMTASMFRDIERNAPVEVEHLIGDMIKRAGPGAASAVLRMVYAHTKTYEARRSRVMTAAPKA